MPAPTTDGTHKMLTIQWPEWQFNHGLEPFILETDGKQYYAWFKEIKNSMKRLEGKIDNLSRKKK